MKAIIWTKYGSPEVLQLQEIPKPTPKDNEVLIKIYATTVTAGDCEARDLKFPFWIGLPMRLYVGPRKPTRVKVLGQELAGEIEAIGKDVTRFKVGDQVFATTGFALGTYAQYTCLPETSADGVIALKPANMSYEEAAAVPVGGLEALHFLQKGNVQNGKHLLIIGAGGSIGTAAVQIAKHFGAEVTAVDSTAKLEMLRSLGADHVIDYTQERFTKSDSRYDVIFDIVGKNSFSGGISLLKEKGIYLVANPRLSHMLRGQWISMRSNKKVILEMTGRKLEDLLFLKELVETGKLKTVIDRCYPLEQAAEAHRYVETGQKKGNLILTVAHNN